MNQAPTVFVVDDDHSMQRVLGRVFESAGFRTESFTSAQAFLEGYDPSRPGCLVLDVRMPGESGLELQEALAERGFPLPIIFMTAHGDIPMSVRAMKSGAVDFLEKPVNEQHLLEAVNHAMKQDLESRQAQEVQQEIERRIVSLTERERQVLEQVVAGKTNRLIAEEWGISEKTVKIHRGRVMQKMQADSVPQLALMAQAAGIRTTKVVSD